MQITSDTLTKEQIDEWTAEHGRAPRIMLFTESADGFGHFNILNVLTENLKKLGADVAIASGTLERVKTVFDFAGATQYDLPHVPSQSPSELRKHPERTPYLEDPEYQRERGEKIADAVREFQPDIIVHELYPFIKNFWEPDLLAAKEACRDNPPAYVSLCRDIMHAKYGKEGVERTLQILQEHFDNVFVRGDGVMNTLEDCEPAWSRIPLPVNYIGNIVRDMPAADPLPPDEHPVLVGLSGAWHDGDEAFFACAIESRKHSKNFAENPWKLSVSENCPPDIFTRLQSLALKEDPEGRIEVKKVYGSAEVAKDEANCAGAVIRPGYNAVFELASLRKPFVVVGRERGAYKEQIMRAALLETSNIAKNFAQEDLAGSPDATDGDKDKAARKLANTLDMARDMAKANQASPLDGRNYNGGKHMATELIAMACMQRERNTPGTAISPDGASRIVVPEQGKQAGR